MNFITFIEDADAAAIASWLEHKIIQRLGGRDGPMRIAIPGGSTPFPIFEQMAKGDLDFSRLEFTMTDDRVVPPDHPASNVGRIQPILGGAGAKVIALEERLDVPAFDLVWLGMGADGHFASLFPNTDPQTDDPLHVRRLTPDPLPPEAPFDRITLTIPALLNTKEMIFVIRGAEKRSVFDAAMAGEHDLPIARLLGAIARRGDISVTCFT